MANAMVALANLTLGSAQATVSFGSIPATGYRDLRLVCNLIGTAATYPWGVFNSDTGGNYNRVYMYGNGSSAGSGANSNQTNLDTSQLITAGVPAVFTFDVMDYMATDKHKTVLVRSNNTSDSVLASTFRWASTSAITSFSINSSNTFAAGSTFSLYGIVSA